MKLQMKRGLTIFTILALFMLAVAIPLVMVAVQHRMEWAVIAIVVFLSFLTVANFAATLADPINKWIREGEDHDKKAGLWPAARNEMLDFIRRHERDFHDGSGAANDP